MSLFLRKTFVFYKGALPRSFQKIVSQADEGGDTAPATDFSVSNGKTEARIADRYEKKSFDKRREIRRRFLFVTGGILRRDESRVSSPRDFADFKFLTTRMFTDGIRTTRKTEGFAIGGGQR
ncbi:MAG: hypothetical protein LBF86_06045 [Helicobacteraceae bacterium]|jgi:hypothetical protein|nr:hypothetical protein [Helicobacteraceae bacterium]